MDLHYINHGPLLNYDFRSASRNHSLDGFNIGPIFPNNISSDSVFSINDFKQSKKNVEAPFPFSSLGCTWSFGSNSNFEIKSQDFSNQSKNLLSTFEACNGNYILHPEKNNDCVKIFLSEVKTNSENIFKLVKADEVIQCREISHIDTIVHNNCSAFTLLNTNKGVLHIRLDDMQSLSKLSSPLISNCALHPSLTDHFYVASSNGTINLYSDQITHPIQSLKIESETKGLSLTCKGGNHPCLVYASNKEGLWSLDFRERAQKQCDIFIPGIVKGIDGLKKELSSFINVPNTPFVYVNLSDQSLLMDSRYSKSPILMWHHLLKSSPCLPFIHSNSEYQVMGILDRYRKKISCMSSLWSSSTSLGNTYLIKGISLTRHFNIFHDYSQNDLNPDSKSKLLCVPVQKHINSPIVGMSVVPKDDSEFSVAYLNNFGDLFFQPFTFNNDSENETTYKAFSKSMQKFENCCFNAITKKKKLSQLPAIPISELPPRQMIWKRANFLTHANATLPSVWDVRKIKDNISSLRRARQNAILKNYISDAEFSTDVHNKESVFDFLPKESKELFDDPKFKEESNPSFKFSAVWDDSDDEDIYDFKKPENGFYFGTQPINDFLLDNRKVKLRNYSDYTDIKKIDAPNGVKNSIQNICDNQSPNVELKSNGKKRKRIDGF